MDFASDSYLNVEELEEVLNGSDPGVSSYNGSVYATNGLDTSNIEINSSIKITYADGSSDSLVFTAPSTPNRFNSTITDLFKNFISDNTVVELPFIYTGSTHTAEYRAVSSPKNITSFVTESGYDITSLMGITMESSGNSEGGLMSDDTATVLNEASNISAITNNVRSSLGRIGNLMQTIDSRSEFLTASIANNTATISSIFDADVAAEQLTATKGNIAIQIGTAMFSQLNSAPQQLLSLF